MLVCLCNALSDRAIRSAAEDGATCCKGVWERCGCRPDCGRCGAAIKEILAAHLGCRSGACAQPAPQVRPTA
ncbi:(2Fe-2S)-binding protein [Elioraea thermophila]|uniref:(2Fe-2S)-binding protein n=1 Tax=Elioraea thermophila TaxID=2185104 RepID=UPI000DF49E35|nr:(2Fe-2S)-binding protein [Elioraea thermophila]